MSQTAQNLSNGRRDDGRHGSAPEAPAAAAPGDANRGASRPTVIVRYGAMGWVGEFVCSAVLVRPGPVYVVIQTERGIELGQRLAPCLGEGADSATPEQVRTYVANSGPEFCRPNAGHVLREATVQDIDEHRRLNAHVREDIEQCAALAARFDLDIKVITAEHLLGGERIIFYFRADGRVDFRELVRELAQRYRTRIEMRQVGARDEARLVADWEVCGRECCCKGFLKKLRPVNMRMAKLQKSTLDPSKVSGRCGRLRCCLRYEHDGYLELQARLPARGSRVRTSHGRATVIDYQVLTQLVLLRTDNDHEYVIPVDEILEFNLPQPVAPAPTADRVAPDATMPPRWPGPESSTAEKGASAPRRRRRDRALGSVRPPRQTDARGSPPGPPANGPADQSPPTTEGQNRQDACSTQTNPPTPGPGPTPPRPTGEGREGSRRRRRGRRRRPGTGSSPRPRDS